MLAALVGSVSLSFFQEIGYLCAAYVIIYCSDSVGLCVTFIMTQLLKNYAYNTLTHNNILISTCIEFTTVKESQNSSQYLMQRYINLRI